MANLLNNPVYVTVQDVRDTSDNSGVLALTDPEIEKYITKAQYTIDNYMYSYGTKVDSTQQFIFPVEDEGIPDDIKIATVYTIENLFNKGDDISSGSIASESLWYYKINYSEGVGEQLLTDNITDILDNYSNNSVAFIKQTL